ncbi:hypothetical protein DEJ23_00295 [Curtobacterium sp. MCSS17_008]|uniref:hypothetical protein n=1 Tax=Curtobacterium sp. MCSS17_008 TaxID=2175647 RepID=UPI000DA9BC87|nr:hypothetical protein [Curtobacterium sp. MCSS17_008]PZF59529.1 hypothetical protein DEJ23_00295 [Curtobacterium sp. MCSS17_008]
MSLTQESVTGHTTGARRDVVLGHVARALSSRTAFVVVLVAFLLLGFFFAITIHVPASAAPDEVRHIGNIMFYAARPWTAGPFVHDAPESTLRLGEVTRFPAYLYYYVMSFPAKAALAVGLDQERTVMVLRGIDVLAAGAGLYALRVMFRNAGVPTAIGLLAIVTTAFTGRYVWQAATISYDAPSMAAFFLFAAVAVKVARGGGLRTLAWLVVTAMLAVMLKYSQVPLLLAGAFFAILFRYRVDGFSWLRHPVRRAVTGFRERPGRSVVLVVVGAVLLALVLERFGVNLLVHRALNPDCAEIHSRAACMDFDIFRRNYNASRAHDLAAAAGTLEPFHPIAFLWTWVTTYFRSLFFFWGPTLSWRPNTGVVLFGGTVLVAAVVVTVTQLRRVLRSASLWWLVAVPVAYTLAVLCFNAATAVNLRQEFAFSGRYLLPVLPMIAAVVLLGVTSWLYRLQGRAATTAWVVVAVVGVVLFALYNPVSAFFPYASSPAWYSGWAQGVLPHWVTGVRS